MRLKAAKSSGTHLHKQLWPAETRSQVLVHTPPAAAVAGKTESAIPVKGPTTVLVSSTIYPICSIKGGDTEYPLQCPAVDATS